MQSQGTLDQVGELWIISSEYQFQESFTLEFDMTYLYAIPFSFFLSIFIFFSVSTNLNEFLRTILP